MTHEELMDKLLQLGDKAVDLANLTLDKMPAELRHAYELALVKIRWDGIGFLLTLFIFTSALWICSIFITRAGMKHDEDFLKYFGLGLGACAVLFTIVFALPSNWIPVFNPEAVFWSKFFKI